MAIFPRHLLFPSPTSHPVPPMWDRPSPNHPIFIAASPPPSQMWSRPATGYPIYEEAVPSPEPMWHRPGAAPAPACPCCMASEETMMGSRPGSSDTVGSSADYSLAARRPSGGLGLRLRKSFRSLRSRASRSTM
ncbi:hypothetical protein CONLIGDRAFT_681541 [Coniochaeta ligniaria NRRL 30616]|uniref:Uncharacterized protein n=1 Tax=Coniochaeta ligniaria NRRL 30616 TaxID=1408157 RepID=A0A1J7J5L7_9PEZI|nr:hypothetical protein CONLIGDRAFT_681541 [Coniochaeta ligniaria NRRL 30616]